jgi:transcriptional accessory protein Tex/SPT6
MPWKEGWKPILFEVLQGTLVSLMDIHQARKEAMREKTDASLKEIKAGQKHLKEEIKASKEETKEEMKAMGWSCG